MTIADDVRTFRARQRRTRDEAGQMAAFFLATGIDLSAAVRTRGEERKRVVARLKRLIERERLKGARRHWSYDLNRHIALKEVLDRLRPSHVIPKQDGSWTRITPKR